MSNNTYNDLLAKVSSSAHKKSSLSENPELSDNDEGDVSRRRIDDSGDLADEEDNHSDDLNYSFLSELEEAEKVALLRGVGERVTVGGEIGATLVSDQHGLTDGVTVDSDGNERTRSGFKVGTIVDEDLERINQKFDQWNTIFKREMLDTFYEVKRNLIHRYENALQSEHRQLLLELEARENAVEELKEKLAQSKLDAKEYKAGFFKLKESGFKRLVQDKEHRLLSTVFKAWHSTSRARQSKMLTQFMRDSRKRWKLKRAFQAWQAIARASKISKMNQGWQEKIQEKEKGLTTAYELQIKELKGELANTKEEVQKELAEKLKYQAQLKRAFMRGVCALNLEAMNLLKSGGLPMLQPLEGELSDAQVQGSIQGMLDAYSSSALNSDGTLNHKNDQFESSTPEDPIITNIMNTQVEDSPAPKAMGSVSKPSIRFNEEPENRPDNQDQYQGHGDDMYTPSYPRSAAAAPSPSAYPIPVTSNRGIGLPRVGVERASISSLSRQGSSARKYYVEPRQKRQTRQVRFSTGKR